MSQEVGAESRFPLASRTSRRCSAAGQFERVYATNVLKFVKKEEPVVTSYQLVRTGWTVHLVMGRGQ